jgi:uncharacterized protein
MKIHFILYRHLSMVFLMVSIMLACITCCASDPIHILVFSKTEQYRHESISSGIKMLYDQSTVQNWIITATEDPRVFNDSFLSLFDVAVFLNPGGHVMEKEQQAAFEKFIRSGKGFVGIHAAAAFEYDWTWYGKLNGGHFSTHPPAQIATVIIEERNHPAMKPFANMKTYTVFDEWYSFRQNPRENVNVLITLDESTITKSSNDSWRMGDHPLVWWHEFEGSRSFYSGFGHTHEVFQNPIMIEHFSEAINWAGKR